MNYNPNKPLIANLKIKTLFYDIFIYNQTWFIIN